MSLCTRTDASDTLLGTTGDDSSTSLDCPGPKIIVSSGAALVPVSVRKSAVSDGGNAWPGTTAAVIVCWVSSVMVLV